VIIEGLGVPSVIRSDCNEFYKCLSIDKLIASRCKSSMNIGSGTKSINSKSNEVLNNEVSKYSSKGWSSR